MQNDLAQNEKEYPTIEFATGVEELAVERGHGRGLVVLHVEHGVEFCNLKQVLNSFSQM